MAGKQLSDGNPTGTTLGQSATDLIAFHGETPTSQRASATLSSTLSLFAISGASYCANTSASISGRFAFNSAVITQIWDALTEIRAVLVHHGLHNGGA